MAEAKKEKSIKDLLKETVWTHGKRDNDNKDVNFEYLTRSPVSGWNGQGTTVTKLKRSDVIKNIPYYLKKYPYLSVYTSLSKDKVLTKDGQRVMDYLREITFRELRKLK